MLGAKVRALAQGRYNVSFEDIQAVATAALRHRLILNFEAEAEGITTDHDHRRRFCRTCRRTRRRSRREKEGDVRKMESGK